MLTLIKAAVPAFARRSGVKRQLDGEGRGVVGLLRPLVGLVWTNPELVRQPGSGEGCPVGPVQVPLPFTSGF
jgi:hypothetical protein